MSIRVALHHRTHYAYDRRVRLGPQVVRLRPAPHSRTLVRSYSLQVSPKQHFLNWQQDPFGNWMARLVFPEVTDHLTLEVDLTAELSVINPFDFFLEEDTEVLPWQYAPELRTELAPYLKISAEGPRLEALVRALEPKGRRTVDFLVDLNRRVHELVRYVIRLEPGVQTPEETLELASGSCRDSAWLLVQVLRRLGIAARFASGYLIQLKADQKALDGPSGPEQDFTDLHAWAEAYLPGAGWIGLDATSGLLTAEGHIPLSCTPDPASAAPITGVLDECEVDFHHEMRVVRVHETPRVTAPYTDDQWQAVLDLGRRIDEDLEAHDVRLTMGGEPTFVSIDDMDGDEWNYGALGEHKRERAGDLFLRLARRFAKYPLLHYGQGKWYPGEQLPRWALSCHWRRDGEPVWRDARLFAEDGRDYGADTELGERFLKVLAKHLDVDPYHVRAAYEDAYWYMLRERRLPVNVDVFDSRLEDATERARLARVFERGLDSVVGHALPLRPLGGGRWLSGPWLLRRDRLLLVPGDSPMGYRLPMDSLPWVAETDYPYVIERDPFALRPDLPPREELDRLRQRPLSPEQAAELERQRIEAELPPRSFTSAADVVRTALCAEPRGGVLHVFLPPVAYLEDYLDLVAAVEWSAAELDVPVRIEGYLPPRDPRLVHFSVTPDPGVIEVNVHPSASFDELVDVTTAVYEEAREARLGTEKFMLDGRHTGTGGGNHITLGGSSPEQSPFLRRPDLLASLVGFWHDHPALSYLFSGLFIGPTSQAPRVDEGRPEAAHELELALSIAHEMSQRGVPPWLTDRIFRHVLADVTGNTHRAEFSVDKLYSPDGPGGRSGLVELRAFEMPPHPRMSIVQQLLVRALVSTFWEKPYVARVPRWGTELHDRFLLPHFVDQDFRDVLWELGERGYRFARQWFDAHFEFRFPLVGELAADGVELEIRRALEPWHVLPEESTASGTARAVDSSLERLQVRLRGAVFGRHLLACNGALVPLHRTGARGELVAGVRFRAWRLPSSLHPTIDVHAPLTFTLIDTWRSHAVAGCTVRVSHPGGRSYERFPVNGNEAEARRSALFSPLGHVHGEVNLQDFVELRDPDYPFTLDLRRAAVAASAGVPGLGWR